MINATIIITTMALKLTIHNPVIKNLAILMMMMMMTMVMIRVL